MSTFSDAKWIKQLHLLSNLSKVYGSIAANRVQQSRDKVLAARDYLEEMQRLTNSIYVAQQRQSTSQRKSKKSFLLPQNGKRVRVVLGAQTRLYGDLPNRVFDHFCTDFDPNQEEVVLAGKQLKPMFSFRYPGVSYDYVDIDDYGWKSEELAALVAKVKQFQDIYIYYGQFKNSFKQEAAVFSLSAGSVVAATAEENVDFTFEPSLEELSAFIEQQMIATLVSQVLSESQLAKHASRLITTDRVELSIKERLAKEKIEAQRQRHRSRSKKQAKSLNLLVSRL